MNGDAQVDTTAVDTHIDTESPELETNEPQYDYKLTTQTIPQFNCFDRLDLGNYILENCDFAQMDERDNGRGPFETTGNITFQMTKDGDPRRYNVTVCVNAIPERGKGKGKAKAEPVELEAFKLNQRDVATLTSAIDTFKKAGDVDNTVKLMTIKSVWERDGRVSRNDFIIVNGLQNK